MQRRGHTDRAAQYAPHVDEQRPLDWKVSVLLQGIGVAFGSVDSRVSLFMELHPAVRSVQDFMITDLAGDDA